MIIEAAILLIGYLIQTVFLFTALWIMVKLQKLNYTFPGLIGSALLCSALDLIPYFGHLISALVLLFCVWKVTQSEYVDVAFTVFVGYALMFGMNLWLIGSLMGDLRQSALEAAEANAPGSWEEPSLATEDSYQPDTMVASETPAAHPPSNEVADTPAATTTGSPSEMVYKHFAVKGITRNADKSSVAIFTGVKTYTLFVGDAVLMEIPDGTLAVRLDGLGNEGIKLTVEGESLTLALR